MCEYKWPIFIIEISTMKHASKGISDGGVWMFHRSILRRGIRGSGFYYISCGVLGVFWFYLRGPFV